VPLGHARRLAAHQGHAGPLGFLLGLAIMWVFLRTVWGLMWSGSSSSPPARSGGLWRESDRSTL
jgi:hypothetical protein